MAAVSPIHVPAITKASLTAFTTQMIAVMTLSSPAKASVITVTTPPMIVPSTSPSTRQPLVELFTASPESLVAPVRVFQAVLRSVSAPPTVSKAGPMYSHIERKPAMMPLVMRVKMAMSLVSQVTTVAMAEPAIWPNERNSDDGRPAAPLATPEKMPEISVPSSPSAFARSSKTGRASSMVLVNPSLKPSQICWMR